MHRKELPVLLPMHKSIAPLRNNTTARTIDLSAMYSSVKPEPRMKTVARRLVKLLTYFW